jgi:alkanesulfonate monooxygenase SsuD/methylene tetrahydromethanopterin reductase-like flavin-dependent oxidoreductase (luciferase family)
MRLGYMLPAGGPAATPAAIRELARTAEAMGYTSIWAAERALFPQGPTSCAQFLAPVSFTEMAPHDPLAMLAEAAATTERIGIGVSILNIPYHSPALLARNLAALDERSRGRVSLGLGLGSTEEESRAVATNLQGETPAAEFLQALRTIWSREATEFRGEYYYVPYAHIIAQGAQSQSLPMTFVAFSAPAVLPTAALIKGSDITISACLARNQMRGVLREIAADAARCPARMPLALRAALFVTDHALGSDRPIFHGSLEQIQSDIAVAAEQGVAELIIDLLDAPDHDLPRLQARMGQFYALATSVTRPMMVVA